MKATIFKFNNKVRTRKLNSLKNIKLHFRGVGLNKAEELYKDEVIEEFKLVFVRKINCIDIINDMLSKK